MNANVVTLAGLPERPNGCQVTVGEADDSLSAKCPGYETPKRQRLSDWGLRSLSPKYPERREWSSERERFGADGHDL